MKDADEANADGTYEAVVCINGKPLSDVHAVRSVQLKQAGLPYVHEATNESIDELIDTTTHQGKTIRQWAKDFDGIYSPEELLKFARSGANLIKLLYLSDKDIAYESEADQIDEDEMVDVNEFFNLDESIEPEDVVTVKDFIELLRKRTKLDDKLMFRSDTKENILADVVSKAGIALVDLVEGTAKEKNVYEADELDSDEGILEEDELAMKNEGYGWRRGGYGGTGRSYRSFGGDAPRGAAIGWYSVEQLDPKAAGKMPGWRCGPSNFPFEDLLYPERKYKVGTMVMRNKYLKAGSMSGEKYIAIPSYFDAIKNNDEEAISLLNALRIPLDLTFGMNPRDDYSVTYTEA